MGRSRNLCAPARALPALALSLALAAGACSSGAKAHAHTKKGISAIQQVAADAGTGATSQTAMATARPADAAVMPNYSSWTTRRLTAEIKRLKSLGKSYDDLTPAERAQVAAAFRARDVRMSHSVGSVPRGSNPNAYPGDTADPKGGAR